MKLKGLLSALVIVALAGSIATAGSAPDTIRGNYLEVRSCDVYTGPCFANGEMGLMGREAALVWAITEGTWKGVDLSGLSVIAVVQANDTLGDLSDLPQRGRAVLIVDADANSVQEKALTSMAREFSGDLIESVVQVRNSKISFKLNRDDRGSISRRTELCGASTRLHGGPLNLTTSPRLSPGQMKTPLSWPRNVASPMLRTSIER